MFWELNLFIYLISNTAFVVATGPEKSNRNRTKSEPFLEFGCHFEDSRYNMLRQQIQNGTDFNTPLYGTPRRPMMFNGIDDFKVFYARQESVRKFVASEFVHNDLDPFIRFYEDYKNSSYEFPRFFIEYVPTLFTGPKPPHADTFNLIRVYQILVREFPGLRDSFMLGTCDEDVTDGMLATLKMGMHILRPPSDFQHTRLIGIVKLSIQGSLGFLLIDLSYPNGQFPSPVLMENPFHELHSGTYASGKVVFSLLNEDNAYVRIDYSALVSQSPDGNKTYQSSQCDLLFISSSLCSFVQNIEKNLLLDPTRNIVKNNVQNGKLYKMSVTLNQKKLADSSHARKNARIRLECEPDIDLVKKETFEKYKHTDRAIKFRHFDRMEKSDKDLMSHLSMAFGLGQNGLYERLKKMHDIWNMDQKFVTELRYWYKNLMVPSHKKFFLESVWDWANQNIKMHSFPYLVD